jgi:single-strand DNA-binding protein
MAEIAGEYLYKGAAVQIEGNMRTETWDKDGVKQYRTKLRGRGLQLLGVKGDRAAAAAPAPAPALSAAQVAASPAASGQFSDDVPF